VTAGEPSLVEQFGQIDIYLFDQLLKGRISPDMRVLDAGCGDGRNLVYLLRSGCDVWAVDRDEQAVERTWRLATTLRPDATRARYRVEPLDALPFDDEAFDVVIASAVLHFADDRDHFTRMAIELGRVLTTGGLLFARLASSIGIEDRIDFAAPGRYRLPDGSDRFLVDEATLLDMTRRLDGALVDPLKTTLVQGQRAMTTWCVRKGP
jgi:tellurite methyltransferase